MEDLKLIPLKDAAKYLGVNKQTLRNWDNLGKLKAVRNSLNSYRLYKKEDLDKVYTEMNNGQEL